MSQTKTILEMLQAGPVTALDALERAGCFRLAARIADLRQQGIKIETETVTTTTGKHIASYKLKEAEHGRETH